MEAIVYCVMLERGRPWGRLAKGQVGLIEIGPSIGTQWTNNHVILIIIIQFGLGGGSSGALPPQLYFYLFL